jgi:hypothetical protein
VNSGLKTRRQAEFQLWGAGTQKEVAA